MNEVSTKRKVITPIVAGVVGATAGALTMALIDKNKRKKAEELLKKAGQNLTSAKENIQKKAQDKLKEIDKKYLNKNRKNN